MKPFLFLVARPPGLIAEDEHAAILRYGKLEDHQVERLEMDQKIDSIPDLSRYSGVIISGSPYGYLNENKTEAHLRTEENILRITEQLVARDFPTLGLCYGLQMIALAAGGTLTHDHPEGMGAYRITLNDAGISDPLTSTLPYEFSGYAAHDEAIGVVPRGMITLASSQATPIQIARQGENMYGTQHHPEIGRAGIAIRINHYVGVYFTPEEHERVLARCLAARVEHGLISAFTQKYGSDHGLRRL